MIAKIAVSAAVYAIDKPYSYRIPAHLQVRPGVRVIVPFGRANRRSEGIVLELTDEVQNGLKPIESVLDEEPVLSEQFIRMAAFLRERYFCTFYDAIKAMLPAGLWYVPMTNYSRTEKQPSPRLDALARQVLQTVEELGGCASLADLRKLLPDPEPVLKDLVSRQYLHADLEFTRKTRDKTEQLVSLAVPAEEAMEYAEKKRRSAPMQFEALQLLCTVGCGSSKEIQYLTGASAQTLRRLEKLGFVTFSQREIYRSSLPSSAEPAKPMVLNAEQKAVFEVFRAQSLAEKPGVGLLHGVTGSGKTAVYIALIRDILSRGCGALFLVPEISLTPQLIGLLMSHFGDRVAVLHSALRVTERYDAWKRIRQGDANVVIGTRSAVFAPVKNLGLIILDEEQEHTYKSENSPRYHAREVAIYRGSREQALVLLGSATPSIETMHLAKSGTYTLQELPNRYNGKPLPSVEIIDLKQEIRSGNSLSLSQPLQQALAENLAIGKQSILFLNRRGAGRCMICVDCADVPHCPHCSVSLTYHKTNGRLMCHYCGYSEPMHERCPQCGGHRKILGTGTQKIEQELNSLFPDAPVLRMDADTISAANPHDAILERFQKEQIPFLVGTQMVTKGLNFENVTLVGVVDADMSLYVNHYRAAETTFSMLTQVIGRSGRGIHPGRALIQTMTPEHAVISLGAKQDYEGFYELELKMRQLHRCPPFADHITILFHGLIEQQVLSAAHDFRKVLAVTLSREGLQAEILGPSPAAVAKVSNTYRIRLTLICSNSRLLRLQLTQLLQAFSKNKKYKGISAHADVNSYE